MIDGVFLCEVIGEKGIKNDVLCLFWIVLIFCISERIFFELLMCGCKNFGNVLYSVGWYFFVWNINF